MPAKTAPHIVKRIEDIYRDNTELTGLQVIDAYKKMWGTFEVPKIRRVQEIMSGAIGGASGEPIPKFDYVTWMPWVNDETAEDNAFLLTMDFVCMAISMRHMYSHEAAWCRRLRVALQGILPYDQFYFVSLYSSRTVYAHYDRTTNADTLDLDTILAYKPWLPENELPYSSAVAAGIAVGPLHSRFGPTWAEIRIKLPVHWVYQARSVSERISRPHGIPTLGVDLYPKIDQALARWMGPNPIFMKPAEYGFMGLSKVMPAPAPVTEAARDLFRSGLARNQRKDETEDFE